MTRILIRSAMTTLAIAGLAQAQGDYTDLRIGWLRYMSQPGGSHIGEYPNGTAGLTMATTSCNMGTVNIPWWSIYGDAERSPEWECPDDPPTGMSGCHPSISMSMYRLSDGRLDQIGLSWMKHGWFALCSSQCIECIDCDPSGNHLGVGCSDTYSGGNNAARGDMGPRHEWNPYTNDWEPCASHFDGPNNDCWRTSHSHGAIDHRVRVADADLTDANAQYFYQAIYYVKHEEFLWDNVGWQPIDSCQWDGSRWIFDTSHSRTPTFEPVIRMWDPTAVEVDTGEGLAYVGQRVTQLDDNHWRYLYSVFNYTSNIPFTSFSVPVSAGMDITDVGYSNYTDPEEIWSLDDWTFAQTQDRLTWAGEPYDVDPNANALRYGFLYNFWFTADAPPQPGQVALGLFLPGAMDDILVDQDVPTTAEAIAILHGNRDWDRNDPQTWISFNDHAFGGYIDPKVESDDGVNVNQGLFTFNVVFTAEPFGDAFGGPITTANVTVEQTGGDPPGVLSAVKTGNKIFVKIDRNITLQEWTTLVCSVWDADGVPIVDNGNEGEGVDEAARLDVGFVPSDVNNDGKAQPLDLSRWITSWNRGSPVFPSDVEHGHPDDYLDVSRGGGTTPLDLARVIAALKGQAPFTRNWRNVGMNAPRP